MVNAPVAVRESERGFTLVEVMVAATVLVVGVLGLLTMLDTANKTTARTKAREGAVNLAREAIEAVRAVPYPDLTQTQIEPELKAQPGLADADSGAVGWQIRRRNIVYTVTATVCSVDDGTLATDGYGTHAGVAFCADSATEGTTDNNPDDYKRVKLDVAWQDGSRSHTARQEAVINNPGSAFAPAVKTLTPSTASPVSSTVGSITFTVTTSSRAESVRWTIDNVEQTPAVASNTARTQWTFTWNTPPSVVDGTYLIGAEASDQFGQVGTGRTLTMVLNRAHPAAPSGFVGGRNPLWGSSFAEFEWDPNPERDVVGYRVYERRLLGADRVVCETSVEDNARPTSCFDTNAPSSVLPVTYYVVALAPAMVGTGLEPSASSTRLVGSASRARPAERDHARPDRRRHDDPLDRAGRHRHPLLPDLPRRQVLLLRAARPHGLAGRPRADRSERHADGRPALLLADGGRRGPRRVELRAVRDGDLLMSARRDPRGRARLHAHRGPARDDADADGVQRDARRCSP